MKPLWHLVQRSLRVKIALLLVAASLLPLALMAAYDHQTSRRQLMAATEALLAARADELVRQIDAFNEGLRSSADRLSRMPEVVAYAQALGAPGGQLPAGRGAAALLDLWRTNEPNLRGLALLDEHGIVRLATEPALMGKNLWFRTAVQRAARGELAISDVFLDEERGAAPTIAYLAPVRRPMGAVSAMVALWVPARPLWDMVRAQNALVGPGSYAVLLDNQGIRIAHANSPDVVFHPTGALDHGTRAALLAERRFASLTPAYLDQVWPFTEVHQMAMAPAPWAGIFRGFGPADQQWSYGVARRIQTVQWTVFDFLPQTAVDAQIASLMRKKVVFVAAIMLFAVGVGIAFAGFILGSIRALAQATEAVVAGDLSARVSVLTRGDELGRLGQNFNVMLKQLESQATIMERSRDELDQKVSERTTELLLAKRTLEVEVDERRREHAELERSEKELRGALDASARNQGRLTALFQSGLIGVVVATLDGRIHEVNDTLLDILGYTREEILSGKVPWSSLTPSEWHQEDLQAVETLRQRGALPLREKEYLHEDGHRIQVLVGTTVLGQPADETISFVLDVTQNRQAALAIQDLREVRASEAHVRALLEAIPDGMLITDPDGAIVFANGQAEQLFGYARADLIGKPIELLIPQRFRDAHPHHRHAYAAAPRIRAMGAKRELFGRRQDGSEIPVEVSLSPLQTEGGVQVISSVRDISERLRADEARFRLAAIVETSGDAIIGKTLDGVITSWNEAASRIFGYRADEIVGQPITVLIPPDRAHEEQEILSKLARGERIEQFDTVRLRKDGRKIDVSLTSSPVSDSNGRLVGASKIVRDISERRKAEVALAQAKDTAEAASRELEAFSYSVAHDLRAPLRAMNGFAHLLLQSLGDKVDAEGQDWLQEIVVNAKKMAELIDALLALARLTRSELKVEVVDLSDLARDVIAQLRLVEPGREIETRFEEGVVAEADPRLARALLDNLLANSWKFTSRTAQAQIEFGVTRGERGLTYFVRDNGAGFDMNYAGKLFAPFQRLHASAEFAGTGIGLATSQRIVLRHGGRIWAEGTVGRGASFYFTLPSRNVRPT